LFNPTVSGNTEQATQYLNGKLDVSGTLTDTQAKSLKTSIASAKAIDPDHPFKATAAVVDKVVTTNNYDVSVTAEEIAAQRFVKKDMQFDSRKVTWVESSSDQDPREIVVLDGRDLAVIATNEHNYLFVVDTSDANNPTITSERHFAGVEGPEHAIDAVTGASEHGLRNIKTAPDNGSVYVSVRPEDGDDSVGNDQDDRYGLFRVVISDDGQSHAHNDPSSKRYDSANVGRFHVAADGRVFMEDTDAEVVRILDADLNDTGETLTLPGDIKPDKTFFTDDVVYISSKGVKADPDATLPVSEAPATLHKVDGQAGTVTASMDIEEKLDGLVVFDGGNKALVYGEFYAAIVNLNDMTETRRLPLSKDLEQEIETATVTKDGRYAILAGHENEELWYFDLTLPISRMEKLTPADTRIRALATDAKGYIYAGGRTGFMDIHKLTLGDVLTPKQAIAG
ncbi:MAG: hypothetical protein KAG66_20255, partial [Methylococcales bacterium]|nr:hypothetical protein [Methylococcales bacterium]